MSNQPQKYRKKPVVIEAMQFTADPNDYLAMANFVGAEADDGRESKVYQIPLLVGKQIASPGDWVAKDAYDQFWIIKASVFEATYELAPVPA